LLDDAADECRELGLLPSLLIAKFGVHKVQALEWMVDHDATKEVNSALLAGIALDGRRLVDYVQFVTVGGYGEGIYGNDTND
jgi:hypothetical protein